MKLVRFEREDSCYVTGWGMEGRGELEERISIMMMRIGSNNDEVMGAIIRRRDGVLDDASMYTLKSRLKPPEDRRSQSLVQKQLATWCRMRHGAFWCWRWM